MKHLSKLIREIIPVIIGILIALFINNWNEDRKDKEYLNRIFSAIEKELEDSVADIKDVIPAQMASIDTVDVYLNDDKLPMLDLLNKVNGLHFPTIKTNAWNSISNSKIELISYEKLSALADIEDRKENLQLRFERQLDILFPNLENAGSGKKILFKMTLGDIINAEQELIAAIEEILEKGIVSSEE